MKENDLTEVIIGYKRFGFPNYGGKIEDRHISIIALPEYHVDYMNRKGWYSVIMQGNLFTDVVFTSDSLDSCMAPGFWQTLILLLGLGRDIVWK